MIAAKNLPVEQASCLFGISPNQKPGMHEQYLRQNKKIPFVGWVERSGTQLSASGSTAFHPTYKKMAKVLHEKTGFLDRYSS